MVAGGGDPYGDPMDTQQVRLFVVDDQEIVRLAYRLTFDADPRLILAGMAADIDSARDDIERLLPEVVLTEALIGHMDGLELVRWLDSRHPEILPIVVSAVGHPALAKRARAAGAGAFVDKRSPVEELVATVFDVLETGTFDWAPLVSLDRVVPPEDAARLRTLTEREREVLMGIGEGKINREIADHYDLTEKTVKNYVSHILQKLDMRSRSELAALAGRLDWAEHPSIPSQDWEDELADSGSATQAAAGAR